jgi:N-acetylglucosamine malate deacetylase 2
MSEIFNILAFFAHPDDETILAGGALALLARAGAHVHYLCATRGEGGELGEPPLCQRVELGAVREQELVCAVGKLKGRSLTFLGYSDPLMQDDGQVYSYSDNLAFVAGQVVSSIRQFGIQAVITHGSNGEYGHPAHVFTYQAALTAVAALEREQGEQAEPVFQPPLLYTVSPAYPEHPLPRLANVDDPAHLVLDIRPALEQKNAAALCHRSQNALFVRRASEDAGRQLSVAEVIPSVEGLHRAWPAVDGPLDDELARLLSPYRLESSQG